MGDHDNHVTKVRGILSIQDPTEPDHAATRRYVDQSAAMAAALDTRNPEKGKNFHLQLGGATKNQENALGLNFAGSMFLVNAPGLMVLFHLVYQRVFQTLLINIWANFLLAYLGNMS